MALKSKVILPERAGERRDKVMVEQQEETDVKSIYGGMIVKSNQDLVDAASEAREAHMSYGQWQAKKYVEEMQRKREAQKARI